LQKLYRLNYKSTMQALVYRVRFLFEHLSHVTRDQQEPCSGILINDPFF